jgi:hypothetical protein
VPKSSKPREAKSQHERFIETARALECDEDKERFEEKLKQIATAKPNSSTRHRSRLRATGKPPKG